MSDLLPPLQLNYQGEERRVGIEIEFAGVQPGKVLDIVTGLFGGERKENHLFDYQVKESALGDFRLELDSSQLQSLAESLNEYQGNELSNQVESVALPLLSKAAELLVPWEVVTAPIPLSKLPQLFPLVTQLQLEGALGTRHSLQYAFGLHLNPDLPDLSSTTILKYLKAYLCLYDWIQAREKIDWIRKITPYIRHFDEEYIRHVLAPDYQPTIEILIDDYLSFNPTRNRSLDLLPLFSYIDEQRVKNKVDDDRVNARPTFHYRLPNCDIDNPDWNIDYPWKLWLKVERLVNDEDKLLEYCNAYLQNNRN